MTLGHRKKDIDPNSRTERIVDLYEHRKTLGSGPDHTPQTDLKKLNRLSHFFAMYSTSALKKTLESNITPK